MNRPFFSIIIPVYNTPETLLRRCLDSVVNQDYKNFELICINDGSTNNCLEVLGEYAQKFPQVKIISKPNSGISSARNTGLETAMGEYLLFSDHDDYFLRNTVLSELAEILQKDDLDCIYFPVANVGEGWYVENNYEEKIYERAWDCLEEHCLKPKLGVFGSIWCQCYKASVIKENNLIFEEVFQRGTDDRLFTVQFFYFAQKTFVYSKPIYCWVTHEAQTSEANKQKINKQKTIEEAFLFAEHLNMFLTDKKDVSHTEIKKYNNGFYRGMILYAYNNKLNIPYSRKLLLKTGKADLKCFIKSVIMGVSVKLYSKLFKKK